MSQEMPGGGAPQQGSRLGLGAISSGAGAVLLLIVLLQNTEDVTVNFLFWDFTLPLWLFTIATALLGGLVWFGVGVLRRHRRRKARRAER